MAEFAANFLLNNNSIDAQFDLSEGAQFDALFEIYASGTVWGTITGTLSNQTDLQATLDLKADKTELNTAIQNEAATRAENDTLLQNNINTLSQTVTANYNTLDGKIDTEIANRTAADTTLQNNINAEALARQNADTTLQGNINTLSGTVTSNYNALDARITTNTGNISDINTTLSGYGNIVTHNVSEFATSAQGALADTALQPNDNISELVNDVGYITSASLPTDYVPETRTINGYALSSNITLNYTDVGALSASTTINDLTTAAQQNALNSGATTTNIGQITTNANNISGIQDLIPNQASSLNQLADKSFVNSSIATNTANFIGTFNSVAELEAYSGTLTNNDYAFVATTDTAGNTLYDRYKYNADTQEWLFEYELNNSSFTAQQWASINSGATSTNIGQITTNANNIADLQTNKQNTISDLSTIRSGASAGATALQPNDNITELVNNAGYITGITSSDVTTALGYTPYNATNPNHYIANIATGSNALTILGNVSSQSGAVNIGYGSNGTGQNGVAIGQYASAANAMTVAVGSGASALGSSAIQIGSGTNSTANTLSVGLGQNNNYQLLDAAGLIPDARISSDIARTSQIPTNNNQLTNGAGYITGITSSDVTTALGYTPLSNATKYGSSLSYSSNVLQLLDQDGNGLGSSVTIQSSPDIDGVTISTNSDDELQAIGVIDDNSGNAIKTWTGTKAQYDAIVTKDATTLYNIVDDTDTTLTLLELLFPVGAVYFGTMATCPLQTLGVGTWQALPPDKVIQIAGTRGSVGDTLNESLPNIKGSVIKSGSEAMLWKPHSFTNTGALYTESASMSINAQPTTSGYTGTKSINLDASRSSSTYQNDAPVQQDAYLLNGWRRIA